MASRKWLERIARNRNVVVGILSRLRLRNGLGFPVLEVLELPINKVTALSEEQKQQNRELQRKEKALAEAAALLVLTKKAQAIWGGGKEK